VFLFVYFRKQSALGVAKGFAHVEGKSIFGGKLGYLNSGFVKQMGLDKVRAKLGHLNSGFVRQIGLDKHKVRVIKEDT